MTTTRDMAISALVTRIKERDALIDVLALHLRRAIHDLIEDWEPDGPQMRYEDARRALERAARYTNTDPDHLVSGSGQPGDHSPPDVSSTSTEPYR